jgi:hypothetical protein
MRRGIETRCCASRSAWSQASSIAWGSCQRLAGSDSMIEAIGP